MTDEELIARLRAVCTCNIDSTPCMAEDDCRDAIAAADRIEALVKERDEARESNDSNFRTAKRYLDKIVEEQARSERLEAALRGYACDCGEVCEACGNDCGLDARVALEGGAA